MASGEWQVASLPAEASAKEGGDRVGKSGSPEDRKSGRRTFVISSFLYHLFVCSYFSEWRVASLPAEATAKEGDEWGYKNIHNIGVTNTQYPIPDTYILNGKPGTCQTQ